MAQRNTIINRRDFIAATSVLSLGAGLLNAQSPDQPDRPKINLGLVGCGQRGDWLSELFTQHGGYRLVAVADYFPDRTEVVGNKFGVPANRRFTTLSGYKQLLECKEIDAVVIISPPFFHPEQAQAAVDAGKHVYLAKPIAVDVPGCQTIERSGQKATENKLCFLVDFQTRSNEHYQNAIQRVHGGAIGDIAFGECTYHGGWLPVKAKPGTPEARLRNWVFDKALSGDIITEQNIHSLDVMSWIMNTPPLRASGTGGRKVRTDVGDCRDYFTVIFECANNVGITFSSRQFNAHDTKPDGIRNRMFGTNGVLEANYGGQVLLRSKDFYKGQTGQIYKQGAVNNIANFYTYLTDNKYDNPTVSASVRSNLVTILGRTAAYQNKTLTWQELMESGDIINGKLDNLKS